MNNLVILNMKEKTIIVKIGGKILENKRNIDTTIKQFNFLIDSNHLQKIIIIPGGGSYANFVRILYDKLKIGDDLAHWMAIYAMNLNGISLSKDYGLKCIENIANLQKFLENINEKTIKIFLPFNYLRDFNVLPHNWDVTSDSITYFLVSHLGLKNCYLIKDTDGIITNHGDIVKQLSISEYKILRNSNKLAMMENDEAKLKRSRPIDKYLIKLIEKYGIKSIILNGSFNTKRIADFFDDSKIEKEKIYTKIIKNN